MAPRHSHSLVRFAVLRGRATAQKLQEFLEPDWCREFLQISEGPWRCATAKFGKVRCFEETGHRAEITAIAGA